MDCIFCKIIAGEIPGTFVRRDDDVVVLQDVNPQAPLHVLVMPARHVSNLCDFTDGAAAEQVAKLFRVAAEVGAGNADGFRTVVNTGPQGGQTVDHLHLHVLAGRQMHWPPG